MTNFDSSELLEQVEKYFKSKLNCKLEVAAILEFYSKKDFSPTLEEITFTAKYINGLMRVLNSAAGNPEIKNIAQLKTELSDNLQSFRNNLEIVCKQLNSPMREKFENEFLSLTHNGMSNLQKIISDFERIKIYFNIMKTTSTK